MAEDTSPIKFQYEHAKIYKLINSVDDKIYIGLSIHGECTMFDHVKFACKGGSYKYAHFDKIGWKNVEMVLIEQYKCDTMYQLRTRKRFWMETLKPSLNTRVPTRSPREHYEANRDVISAQKREYRAANDEKLNAKSKCGCGSRYTSDGRARHMKTAKHRRWASEPSMPQIPNSPKTENGS